MVTDSLKDRFKKTLRVNLAPDVAQAQVDGTTTAPVGTPDNPSDKILTLANFITICRFARSTQTVSWFGKVTDPLMDRVLLFTGVLGLVIIGTLPLWVAIFVIGRDLVLLGGNIYLRQWYKRPVDVIYIGKVSTALFMTGFCFLLVNLCVVSGPAILNVSWLPGLNGQPASLGIYMVYIAIVLSTITAVIYYKQGFAIRDAIIAEQEAQGE